MAVASASGVSDDVWRFQLHTGQSVDVLDTVNKWCEATVVSVVDDSVLVHFRGWSKKFDEWLPLSSPRLAPPYSHVRPWRDLKKGDRVQVRTPWKDATVIAVEPSKGPGLPSTVRVQVDDGGKSFWLSSQDEFICESLVHPTGATSASKLDKKRRREWIETKKAKEQVVDAIMELVLKHIRAKDP